MLECHRYNIRVLGEREEEGIYIYIFPIPCNKMVLFACTIGYLGLYSLNERSTSCISNTLGAVIFVILLY